MRIYIFEENIDKMGGVERIVSLLANNLSSSYEVVVISLKKARKQEFFPYQDNIQRIYIDRHNYLSTWHNNSNIFKKKIYSLYYRLNNLFLKSKKKSIFNKITPNDILIFGRIQVALKWFSYLERDYKIIIRDANHYYCHNEKEKRNINNLLNNYCDLLIVSSDESKKVYEDVLGEKHPLIKKIYNPLGIIPENLYSYSNKKIVAVGRMDNQKAFDVLLKAFRLVNKEHPTWRLEIIGPKPDDLKELITNLKIEDSVNVISDVKDIKKALNKSSLYVMTSRYEGYANSLVEALSCGIPSISFDWMLGVDEIIKNKENGEIVKLNNRLDYFNGKTDDKDILLLAETINKLIDNQSLMDNYALKALEISVSRDKDKIINLWKKEIERLKNDKKNN